MTVLLATDCFDIAGFSSTTGSVCSVVGGNDIEEDHVHKPEAQSTVTVG
jgi:hypothetical protein